MKSSVLVLTSVALALTLAACSKGGSTAGTPQPAGTVSFPDAGIAINVADGWKSSKARPEQKTICSPVLIGPAGMIRVILYPEAISDLNAAASVLRANFDGNYVANGVKDSFRVEDFTSESGLRGKHISFNVQAGKNGSPPEMRNHDFAVQRQDGRCVVVEYNGPDGGDNDAVQQTLQKSLKLL